MQSGPYSCSFPAVKIYGDVVQGCLKIFTQGGDGQQGQDGGDGNDAPPNTAEVSF